MQFSVIIPVYNAEAYLERCLDTILCQDNNDYEVILVNDGSVDQSREICQRYMEKYDNIKLIDKENGGPSSARRRGCEVAAGKYILCVDADDYVDCDLFRQIGECIENNPGVDIVCFGYKSDTDGRLSAPMMNRLSEGTYTDLESIRKRYLYDSALADDNTGCMIYTLWCKAIKRQIFVDSQNAVTDGIKNGEDILLIAYALAKATKISVIDYVGYYYSNNQQSITHIRKPIDLINVSKVTAKMEKIGAYPLMNVAHNYLSSIFILVRDIARASHHYNEYIEMLHYLSIDPKYLKIRPYGAKMKMRYKLKYRLVQRQMWRLIYLLSKVH